MTFQLTEPQIEKLNLWLDNLKNRYGKRGFITYHFTYGNLGLYISVTTSLNKSERLDLTDYDNF